MLAYRLNNSRLLCLLLAAALAGLYFSRGSVESTLVSSAAKRQIDYLCIALDLREVSREDLCSQPLDTIPRFRNHFAEIKQRDEAWYQSHGWSYLPRVECTELEIRISLMDRKFSCKGSQAEQIR